MRVLIRVIAKIDKQKHHSLKNLYDFDAYQRESFLERLEFWLPPKCRIVPFRFISVIPYLTSRTYLIPYLSFSIIGGYDGCASTDTDH